MYVAYLDHRGRIYVGDHQLLLHTLFVSSSLMVSEKKIFEGSLAIQFIYKHMKPLGHGQFGPPWLD